MRVALCLSGQVRGIETNIASIRSNIVESVGADVFCHFWDSGLGGWAKAERAVELLQPKLYQIEQQVDFTKFPGAGNTILTRSQFYSVKKSNNLKKRYESQSRFTYDLVIRSRTDLVISKPFVPEFYMQDPEAVYALPRGADKLLDGEFILTKQTDDPHTHSWKFLDDMFLVANSRNMDLYAMIYDYIDELVALKKDDTYGTFVGDEWRVLPGASITGEMAMTYNFNKSLAHVRALATDITRQFTMVDRNAP